ncbi:hypothetical protein Fmac_007771 [Flemingia macrophylla]|uniref:Uncharacterized protein n=1 Tax=Flemingia macrophylla TaxID=520843 RepID=A0ABD1MVJ5_9FABA
MKPPPAFLRRFPVIQASTPAALPAGTPGGCFPPFYRLHFEQNFDIPNTKVMRKKILSIMVTRWRNFKTYLTREYVHGKKKDKDPCHKYVISEEDWMQFRAADRTTLGEPLDELPRKGN